MTPSAATKSASAPHLETGRVTPDSVAEQSTAGALAGSPVRVLGLDLSLTASGISPTWGQPTTLKTKSTGVERLSEIASVVVALANLNDVEICVIEGYSFGSRNSHSHALGELGGVVKTTLHRVGIPFVSVPPSTLKKFATGKGNADKFKMQEAAIKRAPEHVSFPDHNAVDAWWLMQAGLTMHNDPSAVFVPEAQREAIYAIDWPELKAR